MKANKMVYTIGEGQIMKNHYDAPYIEKEFPERIITWPIAEDSGINFALGASLLGVHPIYDIITADFSMRAFDSIANTCATTNYILGEEANPILIRAEFLLFAPSTGQRTEALFSHIPNLNVVIPSNPIDAYYLTHDALSRRQVTMLLEDRMIKDSGIKEFDKLENIANAEPATIGEGWIRKPGDKLTIVSYALCLQRTEEILDRHPEWDVELIDLRTIKPYDKKLILNSVSRTKKLLVVEPDIVGFGVGAEIVAMVAENIDGVKVKRIGEPMRTIPASQELHDFMIPNEQRIVVAIKEMLVK